MKPIFEYSKEQYEWVKASRGILLEYCESIANDDFIKQHSHFGRGGSIRNLLVHSVNAYQFWIANTALQQNLKYSTFESCIHIDHIINIYAEVDVFMNAFLSDVDFGTKIEYLINGVRGTVQPFKLFSHVITHEYHHKGQILSLSRQLGYNPVDTDIMR